MARLTVLLGVLLTACESAAPVAPEASSWAPPSASGLQVEPASVELAAGQGRALRAARLDAAGRREDVTELVRWEVRDPRTARLTWRDGAPRVEGLSPGATQLVARDGAAQAVVLVTVREAELATLALAPAVLTLLAGRSQALTAVATYTDGTSRLVTGEALFASTAPQVAQVHGAGLLVAGAAGEARIVATFSGLEATGTVTVTPPHLTALVVRPATPALQRGSAVRFTAEGVASDGTRSDLTAAARWASSNPWALVLSGSEGLARAPGASVVTATVDAVTGSTLVTVEGEPVVALEVFPLSPVAVRGTSRQLLAVATWADGSTEDVTAATTFSTSEPAVAELVVSAHHRGLVHARGAGTATLTASAMGLTATTTLLVTSGTLVDVEVTGAQGLLRVGGLAPLTARGRFSDGVTLDLTWQATWRSSRPDLVSASNELATKGTTRAVRVGTAWVSIDVLGRSASVPVTVAP